MKMLLMSATALIAVGHVGLAAAADPMHPATETVEVKDPSGWVFTVSSYSWLAGLEGDVGAAGSDTRRRVSFLG